MAVDVVADVKTWLAVAGFYKFPLMVPRLPMTVKRVRRWVSITPAVRLQFL